MAELTNLRTLEDGLFTLPRREFLPDSPTSGRIICTRLEDAAQKPDALGDIGQTVVELGLDGIRRLLPRPIVVHSPTGFEWGYGGSGPADLAANCLAVVLPLKEAWRLHQDFKRFAITTMDRDVGEISIRSMRLWIAERWHEELSDPDCMEREAALRGDLEGQ